MLDIVCDFPHRPQAALSSDLCIKTRATTQVVEYGDSLTGWTPVSIPATSSGAVTITPGSPSDHVKVTLPNPGTKLFVRLKVANTPP